MDLSQLSRSWMALVGAALMFVGIVIMVALILSIVLRKFLRGGKASPPDEFAPPQPKSENQAAFMAASMQAVIQRLREQEKELERLHRVEKDRAHQTERLSAAVTRDMPTGLLLVSSNGLIQMANPAAETALGLGALGYRRYSDVFRADSRLRELLASCLQEGRTYQREEVEHRTSSGEARQLGVTMSPTFTHSAAGPAQARPAGALCLLSDLTELTALQKQVRLKENMAALGEMSAGIAHEFKNALAIISGYAQMIRADSPPGDLAESAERILNETRALTHVVTEFLRFARPLDLSQEPVPLRAVVEQVVKEVGEAMPRVALRVEGDFQDVLGDSGMLRQALLNLARNAAESAAEHSPAAEVVVRGTTDLSSGPGWQRISVEDNGPGISPENLTKVFVPFFTTKSNGTGLGLAVVQKIALQHGGRVEATNQAGGGAEFILWLPLKAEAAQAVDSGPAGI